MHDVNFEQLIRVGKDEMVARNEDHHKRMESDHNERAAVDEELNRQIIEKDNATRDKILSHVKSGGVALDMGVGGGGSYPALAKLFDEVHGIDVVDKNFHLLGHYASLTKGAIEELPYKDNKFDCVFSAHVMEHTFDIEKSMTGIMRVLKPGGYVANITPHYFPDPEIAHITQLGLNKWVEQYKKYGFEVLEAYINEANCEEAHIVARKPL